MSRHVLIAQTQPTSLNTLTSIFDEWGDSVERAENLDELREKLRLFTPDLLVFDIELLGKDWAKRLPTIRKRLPSTDILFTHTAIDTLPEQFIKDYKRWGILTGPFSRYGVRYALQEGYAQPKRPKPASSNLPRVWFPIRYKITWPYIVLAFFFTITMSFIISRVVFDSIEERFTNQLIEAGRLSSEWMVSEETRLLETLRLVSNTQGVSNALESSDTEQLKEVALPIAINDQIEAVELLNLEGESVLSLRKREGGNMEEYAIVKGDTLFRDWKVVQSIIQGTSDGFGNKFVGIQQAPWGDYLYIAGPIHGEQEKLVGVILVGTRLTSLVLEMRSATLAQTTLYDFEGNYLASTFLEPQIISMENSAAALSLQNDSSLVRNINVANIEYSEILGPWEARHDTDFGILGVALPQSFFIQTSTLTRVQIFAVLIMALVLITLIGFVSAGRISLPVRRLMRASSEVAKGNLRVEIEQDGADEVAALTFYFNEMVSSLRKSNLEIMEAYESSLEGWSRALTLRDHETDEHSKRVVDITMRMARASALNERELVNVRRGALLHDIGKMAIPDSILLKPGSLNPEERQVIEQHPIHAYEMLKGIPFLKDALDIPRFHHERWDGRGYPYGVSGEDIPLSARIFSIADVFDALNSDRPYRKAWPLFKIKQYMHGQKGTAFDPQLVDLFFTLLEERFKEADQQSENDSRRTVQSKSFRVIPEG